MRGSLRVALAAAALVLLPGIALADGDHEHGASGPANPMVKSVTLYLQGDGSLGAEPAAEGKVSAGPAMPDGTSQPVLWSVEATRNTILDDVFVELYVQAERPSLVAGGPEGAAFRVQLARNGEAIEGAESLQRIEATVLQPGQQFRLRLFLAAAGVSLAPGDTLGLLVSFYGLNPEGSPAVVYLVGGSTGSRIAFALRMASVAELDLPAEVGPWPVAPLAGFDFEAARRADPGATVVALKAFQFGFEPAPIVVANGTRVVLHLYVDESLGVGEGHGGHAHGAAAKGHEHEHAWDAVEVTPLHGFSLAALRPGLETVLFEGLVVTMDFVADKPGNYSFLCTVFCGSGHGSMRDVLVVLPPEPYVPEEEQATRSREVRSTPGLEAPALLAAAALAALAPAARRR